MQREEEDKKKQHNINQLNRASQRITTKVYASPCYFHIASRSFLASERSHEQLYGQLYMPLCLLVCCIYILLRDYMLICEQQHALPRAARTGKRLVFLFV